MLLRAVLLRLLCTTACHTTPELLRLQLHRGRAEQIAEILNELVEACAQAVRDTPPGVAGGSWGITTSDPVPVRYASEPATNSILVLSEDAISREQLLDLVARLDADEQLWEPR